MSRFGRLMAIAAAGAAALGFSAGAAAASTVTVRAPDIYRSPVVSSWASGYAAVPKAGGAKAFRRIQVTYRLPRLNCAKTPNDTAVFRAGIDGISDDTIERVGVNAFCMGTSPGYDAWYQMVPNAQHLEFAPIAGDKLRMTVSYVGGTSYQLSIQDLTAHMGHFKHFTVTRTCPPMSTCQNASAQVTAGSPGPLPLTGKPADFGVVIFRHIVVTDMKGVSGGLHFAKWNTDKLFQPGGPLSPHTVAGPLPVPYTAFKDFWKP